jgi:hypothetical protein
MGAVIDSTEQTASRETHELRNEMKKSRQMRTIFQSRRGIQASLKGSERFTCL